MIMIGPTPGINCINCAHAHVPPEKGPCPTRDFTGRSMLCPGRSRGTTWTPLGYLVMIGQPLTETEAAQRAAAELKAERQLSPAHLLEKRMGTAVATKQAKYVAAFEMIDAAAQEYSAALDADSRSMVETIQRAGAIATIKEALTDEVIEGVVKPFMDSPMGFMTDRASEQKGYPVATLRECVTQAMLHGARIDGNEFNIIKGRPMLVQAYWKRQVSTLPGVTDIAVEFGAVEYKGDEAFVECLARWNHHGTPTEISRRAGVKHAGSTWDRRIVVPVNRSMGRDALLGKAERRIYKEIFERVTGRRVEGMDEDDAIDAEFTEPKEVAETVEEDPQEVADEQARLREEYVNLLGQARDNNRVDAIVKSAKEDKSLLADTLEAITEAGRQRWRQLKAG